MDKLGCDAYTDKSHDPRWKLENVPSSFALRLDLDYPDGGKVVLIYNAMPSEREQQDLMWMLQTRSAKYGFKLTRTNPGESPIKCPPIGGKK